MSLNDVLYKKVSNIEKTRFFRIKTEWEDECFRLYVIASSNSWFSLVTHDYIQNLSESHNLDCRSYFNNLKECFDKEDESFSFDVKDDQFVVYSHSKQSKISMKYFFTPLAQIEHQQTIENIFDELIQKYSDLVMRQKTLEEEKLTAVNERYQYERKLEEFVNIKNQSDLKMTSSFLLLLNEKKKRIRYLTDLIEKYQSSQELELVQKPEIKFDEVQPSTSGHKETISDSDSSCDVDYNTEDEKSSSALIDYDPLKDDNLDCLGNETILVPSLPKRNKIDQSMISLQNCTLENPKEEIRRHDFNFSNVINENDIADNSNNQETLNTQDLLDMI